MKLTRSKIISSLFVFVMLSANAYASILHTETTQQTITKGASYIKERVLTNEGWRDINMLRIDLKDPNVALKPIESATLGERKTILSMANETGAIAAVNSDFFDMSATNTVSFGPVIENGQLKHAYNDNYIDLGPAKYMGTFLLDNNNNPSMAYYGTSIMLYANGSAIGGMATYNNMPSKLQRPIVLDNRYQQDTSKAIAKYKGTYTVVVENGQVIYLAKQDEVVPIPQNGYVILINTNDANAYYSKLPVGAAAEIKNTIYLSDGTTKAIEDIKMGVGGSGIIIKDGEEYTGPSHKVTGTTRAPRTVVATVKNSSDLLLIAIDGRNETLGANHKDLVSLLKSLNVQDAMYFDGGGSTTFVSRAEGEKEVKLLNDPSDGSQRKVVNGVGVFTTSETGSLSKLYLDTAMNRSFVGEPISFAVKGIDENYNPVDLDKTKIKLTVTGINGAFKGLVFNPQSAGKALVIANYNGVEVAKEIYISEKPTGIRIEPSNLQLSANTSKTVQIYGIDKQGYKIPLSADKVTWKSTSGLVSGSQNQITAQGQALATLTASYKDITAKLGVIVGDASEALESFEQNMPKWGGDKAGVKGKVEPSAEVKYEGNSAVKMTYTFLKSSNRQAANMVFSTPIVISDDAMSVNMWVNAKNQGDTAKIEVKDAAGKFFYLKVADQLNFTGWKYFSVPLPADMTFPAKVTKFYTYANAVSAKRTSAVYIDHVSMTKGFRDKQGITVRDDYRFDPLYKESLTAPKAGQYQINAIGPTKSGSMTLDKKTIASIGKQLSQNVQAVLFASQSNSALPISVTKYTYNNDYKTVDYSNVKIIFAGTDKGGLRLTNANEWLSIKKDIEGANANNIILVMSKNPLTQFDDADEGLAFHRYLKAQREATGKNIFVIYTGGNEKEVRIEDGIRYIRSSGLVTAADNVQDGSFIKFKIVGNEMYYTFEKIK